MKVGLTAVVTASTIDIVSPAIHAERLGFEPVRVPEHPAAPVERRTPFPGHPDGVLPDYYKHTIDPLVGLAAAAGAGCKVRPGTGIRLVPERNPLHTAREGATLDHVSVQRMEQWAADLL